MPKDDEARNDLLVLNEADNIAVLKRAAPAGSAQRIGNGEVVLSKTLEMGHKIATRPIARGEDVLKYGFSIGYASSDIAPGEHVHLHNLTSRYTVIRDWEAEQ